MGVMRLARGAGRLFRWGIGLYILMTVAMLGWTFVWPEPDVRSVQPADAIMCLGGGMDRRGTLAQATLTRVDRCVQLYEAGLAPVIIFSGGTPAPTTPSAGGQMGRYATQLGVPDSAIIVEGRAQSTLQNALFSLELAGNARTFIVVTEAFHLPRSYASFKWAAWEVGVPDTSIQLVMSEQVRRHPRTGDVFWRILIRESLAIWFNLGRATVYSVMPDAPVDWLH